jgi:hypothetical protein
MVANAKRTPRNLHGKDFVLFQIVVDSAAIHVHDLRSLSYANDLHVLVAARTSNLLAHHKKL